MIRSNFVHFNTQNRLWYVCTTSFSFLTAGTSENTKAEVTITTATVHSNTGIKPKWVYKGKRGRACVCSLFLFSIDTLGILTQQRAELGRRRADD